MPARHGTHPCFSRRVIASASGLTDAEARQRLLEFGPNEIIEVRRFRFSRALLKQFIHFLAVILWVAAALAFLSEFLHPGGNMLTLGLAIVAVILINGVFTFIQEYRAEKHIEKLRLLLPFRVKVIREGRQREIPARELVLGDMIVLAVGDRIAADARLTEASSLTVNNAPLTGESEPVPLSPEPDESALFEAKNVVLAGTTVVSGTGKAVVFATGMETEVGHVAQLTSTVEAGLTPLQTEITRATRIVSGLAALMGTVFFLVGHLMGRTFWENFLFAIGIIVANVPEGLLPTVTLSLAMGSQRMAKKMALMKTLNAVEALGSVTVICTDKTGTLTQNRMEVKGIWTQGEMFDAKEASADAARKVLMVAALCNDATFAGGRYRGDPTETALLQAARQRIDLPESERLREIPFDSERKRMTTVNIVDGRILVLTKGALECVLPLCQHWLKAELPVPISPQFRQVATATCQQLMDRGLRVLALAYREAEDGAFAEKAPENVECGLIFAGLIALEDPPRPEVPEALKKCRDAGVKVIMVTGDASRTAVAIAKEIGLVHGDPLVIEGEELATLDDQELAVKLANGQVLFARMTPKHKMRIVSLLKEQGERVAVTGDGINDAPALKKADVGVAMGITGTDVAREAADMILLDDNFATIVNAIEEGRGVYENIRNFTTYIFSSNMPEIVPYLVFVLFRVPLPLTILQILAIDLGTDMFPALALGVEKPTEELMNQPPRNPRQGLLSAALLSRAYLFLGMIEAAAGLFAFFYVLNQGGWRWGEFMTTDSPLYMQATTACLTAIIVTQIANVFACRSLRDSVFKLGFLSNPLIFFGIAVELIFLVFIVYHPIGNRIFATAPLPAMVWLILIPFSFLLFFAEEVRKAIARSSPHRANPI